MTALFVNLDQTLDLLHTAHLETMLLLVNEAQEISVVYTGYIDKVC